MHGDEFPRSLRLRATSFARVYGEGFRESYKNFAQNCREKFLQNYGKSARFSVSERNNRANFAQNRDKIIRRNLENSEQNHKIFANSGFTIIEVALVLAIAGLIFLVVFLALPALQKSQRDTARRQDVAKVIAALEQYRTDNQGAWPAATNIGQVIFSVGDGQTFSNYFGKLAGNKNVAFNPGYNAKYNAWTGAVDVYVGKKCTNDGTNNLADAAASNAAVVVRLEVGAAWTTNGAGGTFFCEDM